MRFARPNGFFSTVVAGLLVGTAGFATYLIVTSGILTASPVSAPASVSAQAPETEFVSSDPIRVTGAFQISQPRDPFRPLITPDSPVGGIPGVGGVPGTGDGFNPSTAVITLEAIRDVGGVLRATVIVNGVSYDVGVGDTFAGSYKVVSIAPDRAVFTFGDNAFELTVGQQILK